MKVTLSIDCPRLLWSDGVMCECGDEITLAAECNVEDWPDRVTTEVTADLPTRCDHACCADGDDVKNTGAYTPTEQKELARRARRAAERYEPEEPAPYVPCRCEDRGYPHCVC